MGFYARLNQETQAERGYLLASPIIQDALGGRVTVAQYVAFLTQAYHHVKHTVPLLMACGSRLPQRLEWLREAVAGYIAEEIGHDEWILNDIAACGANAHSVRAGVPGFAAEVMIGYAYDMTQRRNPACLFGMVHVLEGTSVQLASRAADVIQATLALPDEAFIYLRSHGALDQNHIQFFAGLMDRLSDPADQQNVLHASKVMFRLYAEVFRSLPKLEAETADAA